MATAAPGVREILTVGKLCYEVRERHYDLVVVDAPATGHIIGQLAAPQAINDLVKVGLIRTQTDWMLDILSDPDRTGLVAVTTPEEMPVAETLELAGRVARRDDGAAVGGGGEPGPARAVRPPRGGGLRSSCARPRPTRAPVRAGRGRRRRRSSRAARLAVTMRRTRAGHLERLRPGLDPAVPVLLPALPVHPVPRPAHHPPGGRVAGRGARVTDGPGVATAPAAGPPPAPDPSRPSQGRSTGCWPPRRSSSPAGPGGWARPPRPPPRRPWPPATTGAGCWC